MLFNAKFLISLILKTNRNLKKNRKAFGTRILELGLLPDFRHLAPRLVFTVFGSFAVQTKTGTDPEDLDSKSFPSVNSF